jgi:arylsulfatase A-like enzyme
MGNPRPNLLVILSDQLRRGALGVYGDPDAVTPNIDRLAAGGVRFGRAYSTYPVCVPFRFSLMTGEYAHSRFVPAIEWRMSPAERTLADEFNAAGYDTIYVGKWHLYGGCGVLPHHDEKRAGLVPVPRCHQGRWKKWLGFEVSNAPFNTLYFEDADPVPRKLPGYQTDGLFDLAMGQIQSRRSADPFCCVISVEPPHFPLQAPRELEERWLKRELHLPANFLCGDSSPVPAGKLSEADRAEALRRRKLYYAMIENLDQNVGRLMDFLRAEKLADNTVVMLVSDHGQMDGAHSERNTIKEHPFEESVGIPLIVSHPGLPGRAGSVIDVPVSTEDLFPTLLGLAGLAPAEPKPGCDLSPLIAGRQASLPREGVMLEFVHDLRPLDKWGSYHEVYWRAFVTDRFKYTVLGNVKEGGRPWQFFDLENDPCEMKNLVNDPAWQSEVSRHHKLLLDRLVKTDDHYALAPAFGFAGLNMPPAG